MRDLRITGAMEQPTAKNAVTGLELRDQKVVGYRQGGRLTMSMEKRLFINSLERFSRPLLPEIREHTNNVRGRPIPSRKTLSRSNSGGRVQAKLTRKAR